MFSGITRGLYEVISVQTSKDLITYTVRLSADLISTLNCGDSVSVDGVCQTVVNINDLNVTFHAIEETLKITTLNSLFKGRLVSIEPSLKYGDAIGGHEVSGHVHDVAEIHEIINKENILTLIIKCNAKWMKYILPKGFIALNGSSLTIGATHPQDSLFHVHLIPETLRLTNFSNLQIGDKINLEIEQKTRTIVDSVENYLKQSNLLKHDI